MYIPAILMVAIGELWFVYRLIISPDIETTMYGFLFGGFIPMAITIAYLFFTYGRDLKFSSAYMLSIGFFVMALSYMAWAPWHFPEVIYIYFIWFDIFNLSLGIIFAGFFALPKETTARISSED